MENNKLSSIDLIALVQDVLKDRKKLFICLGVAGLIGLIVAFSTPKSYTASVVLAPEMSSGGLGMSSNLADMASTFGIDLGSKSSMDAIYPEIYPDVFASTDFVYTLFDVPVRLQDDNNTRTFLHHLKKETKQPFWTYPKTWITQLLKTKEKPIAGGGKDFVDPFRMSRNDWELCEAISASIGCSIDKKTSEITITFTDQDPMVAAIMVDTLQNRLQSYITSYRTKKARNDYDYYDRLTKEAEKKFIQAQREYSSYCDSHKNIIMATASTKQQTLENRMSETYATYAGMKKMREQAEDKIQERTPAFAAIQTAKMPHKPSSTPKIVTLIIFLILGSIVDVSWVLYSKTFGKKQEE